MENRHKIAGRVIAVTGGAQGIGREIARQLADEGAQVVIGDIDADSAQSAAAGIGRGTQALPLDVTSERSFREFVGTVEGTVGPLDVLVNNAGVMWVGPFTDEPESATDRMLDINLHGVIRGVRAAAPEMRRRGRGHIVTVASAASQISPPGESTYAATKHGVLGYLTGVREEMRGSGVRFSIIMPTVVDTQLAAGTSSGGVRMLTPGDVAAAVVGAVARPRFRITVPGYVGFLVRFVHLLPQAVRDRALRLMVPDQLADRAGADARAEYESRVLGSVDDGPGESARGEGTR